MRKQLKIFILAKNLDGGTGTFVGQLTQLTTAVAHRYQLKILALNAPQFRSRKSFSVPASFYRAQLDQPYYYRLTLSALGRLIQEWIWFHREVMSGKPDIVITIDAHCALLGCLEKFVYPRSKLIVTIHNNLRAVTFHKLTPAGRGFMFFVCRRLFRLADAVVGVSEGVSADIQALFCLRKAVRTIYNGCDGPRSVKLRGKALHFGHRFPVLVSVGRLAPQKDFKNIIQALALVKHVFPRVCLFILGDGEERKELEDRVKQLQLTDNVVFLGWKARMREYLKRADMYILSSHFEGFSYSLLEAMQLAIPVISTDTPYGPSEILGKGRYGLLVKPANADLLAEAILSVMRDDRLYARLSRAAYVRSGFFSKSKMLTAYDRLFQSLFPDP